MKQKQLNYFCYDHPQNPWCGGGGSYRDLKFLELIRSKGYRVKYFCGKFKNPPSNQEVPVECLGFSTSHLISRISYSIFAHFKFFKLDPNEMVGYSLSAHAPLFFGFPFSRKSFTVIHHTVGNLSFKKFGILGVIPYLAEKLLIKSYRYFLISNASSIQKVQRGNKQAKILQTQNGIDDFLFHPLPNLTKRNTIIYFGRFDIFMKGLDLLIKGFSTFIHKDEQNKRFNLAFCGRATKSQINELSKLAKNYNIKNLVSFHTNVSDSEKQKLLAECLFFCSPSRFEGWGISAVEALSQGKSVLVSDAEGFRDSVGPSGAALLLSQKEISNPEKFARYLEKMVYDEEFRNNLEEKSLSWANKFHWNSIVEKELAWLKTHLENSN